jgi:hypothetical protein
MTQIFRHHHPVISACWQRTRRRSSDSDDLLAKDSWAIPGGGNIVRNTSVTRDGDFVLANSLVNAVTLVKISK